MRMSLRRARELRRLSVAELADKCGVNKSTVWRIENGDVEPMYRTVGALETALGLKPGTLTFDAHSEAAAS